MKTFIGTFFFFKLIYRIASRFTNVILEVSKKCRRHTHNLKTGSVENVKNHYDVKCLILLVMQQFGKFLKYKYQLLLLLVYRKCTYALINKIILCTRKYVSVNYRTSYG